MCPHNRIVRHLDCRWHRCKAAYVLIFTDICHRTAVSIVVKHGIRGQIPVFAHLLNVCLKTFRINNVVDVNRLVQRQYRGRFSRHCSHGSQYNRQEYLYLHLYLLVSVVLGLFFIYLKIEGPRKAECRTRRTGVPYHCRGHIH